MCTGNKLYWKSDLYPEGKVEVRVTLATYADNDNLYVGLNRPCTKEEGRWEPFTDLTVNQHSLPPFHAYVDNRDYNRGAYEFLTGYGIAQPVALPRHNGFRLFRFNADRLKELAPEHYPMIARKLPPGKTAIGMQEYNGYNYPIRTIKNVYGLYMLSTLEFEKILREGEQQGNAEAAEILESICHFCTKEDLNGLTDEEMVEDITRGAI
ncbi:hypothetical protein JCM10512_3256 [Bacteroides reticulotermitis JCM 10512]|uniref:DUF4313 domain-containing protein n=2 Tax=Bacteroides reticulotermitis TaxID=1133319 RepID=W4UUF6_9BACE|nr:hypothetical protein JCM10512_3256 [Bacteroides reticulotermitis JCM 10512]